MADATLTWDHGTAEVQLLGGMLGPVTFRLNDGRAVSPLAVAPWAGDTGQAHAALPGLMKRLRGEWPCVPFGAPSAPDGLPAHWQLTRPTPVGEDFHGFSAHHRWTVVDRDDTSVAMSIAYPEAHPIAGLERRIATVPGAAALDISLTIHARRGVSTPVALHPVFRLPVEPGGARLDPGPFREGRVFPLPVEPGVSRLRPDARIDDLAAVPTQSGAPLPLDRLPLDPDTEELVQLCGTGGRADLINSVERYRAVLTWDAAVLPSTLLWISNRGRTAYPWNGRFLGLGIEPVRAAFDLGPDVGCDPRNPIAAKGVPTALDLTPDAPFTTQYRIAVSEA